MLVIRGDIWNVDFGGAEGSVQGGIRPALIMQNDVGNKYSPTVQVAPITSQNKKYQPTHVDLTKYDSKVTGLTKKSIVLMEQSTTIPKAKLIKKIGHINIEQDEDVRDSFSVSWGFLSICEFYKRRDQRRNLAFA